MTYSGREMEGEKGEGKWREGETGGRERKMERWQERKRGEMGEESKREGGMERWREKKRGVKGIRYLLLSSFCPVRH